MAVFSKRRKAFRTARTRKVGRGMLRHFVFGGIAIFIAGTCAAALWYVTRLPYVTINEIVVEGGLTVSHDEIRQAASKELDGNYFFLIPKRFTYLYPEKRVLESVRNISRVKDVSVVHADKHTLRITVTEYLPHALWCREVEQTSCAFLSKEGFAFALAPNLSGNAFLRYVTKGRDPEVGTQLFDGGRMRDIEAFIEALTENLSFRTYQVTITVDDDMEYRLIGGGSVLVSNEMGVQDTFNNLNSLLESEEFSHLQPGAFEYIDLRFGRRIFVKEEPDLPIVEEGATSTAAVSE